MSDSLDLSRFNVRTDLAVEAKEGIKNKEQQDNEDQSKPDIGIDTRVEEEGDVKITHMVIHEKGAEKLGKKPGNYLTLETHGMRSQDSTRMIQIQEIFTKHFRAFLQKQKIAPGASGLIVGLGNREVTPDALGPAVVERIIVTKHLFELAPQEVGEGYRPVSAIAPGVMGVTGIETSDIIMGVIEKVNPDFVIAVDALAARNLERVNTTIQVADSGIHPGSGVGNNRKELSKDTLGIPVIAIGIPTVVDAVTIASDSLDYMLKHFGREWREKDRPSKSLVPSGMTFGEKVTYNDEDMPSEEKRSSFLGIVGTLSEYEKRKLIKEVLGPTGHNLIVAPKEADVFIEKMAGVVGQGLNASLHDAVNSRQH